MKFGSLFTFSSPKPDVSSPTGQQSDPANYHGRRRGSHDEGLRLRQKMCLEQTRADESSRMRTRHATVTTDDLATFERPPQSRYPTPSAEAQAAQVAALEHLRDSAACKKKQNRRSQPYELDGCGRPLARERDVLVVPATVME